MVGLKSTFVLPIFIFSTCSFFFFPLFLLSLGFIEHFLGFHFITSISTFT